MAIGEFLASLRGVDAKFKTRQQVEPFSGRTNAGATAINLFLIGAQDSNT
jgi:hypothetical protein